MLLKFDFILLFVWLILLHKYSKNDKIGANIYLIIKEKNVWKKNMH